MHMGHRGGIIYLRRSTWAQQKSCVIDKRCQFWSWAGVRTALGCVLFTWLVCLLHYLVCYHFYLEKEISSLQVNITLCPEALKVFFE